MKNKKKCKYAHNRKRPLFEGLTNDDFSKTSTNIHKYRAEIVGENYYLTANAYHDLTIDEQTMRQKDKRHIAGTIDFDIQSNIFPPDKAWEQDVELDDFLSMFNEIETQIINLHFQKYYTIKQTAQLIGCSVKTINKWIDRTKQKTRGYK